MISDQSADTVSFGVRGVVARLIEDSALRRFFRSPLFWIGLGIKLILGTLFASYFLTDLFIPFVNYFVESGFADPWTYFFEQGRLNAFPYPPMMLYIMATPRFLFSAFLSAGVDTVTFGHVLVMRAPLLAADLGIALILVRWFPARVKRILLLYWLSPLVIHVCYWHGQLDVIPTAILLLGLYLLRRGNHLTAMVIAGLALATKSHILVCLPFLLVYIYQFRGRVAALRGGLVCVAAYFVVTLPYLMNPAYTAMVYGTPETRRLFAFQLAGASTDVVLYLAPAAIVLLWLRFTAYEKPDWDLTMLYLGILFSVFVLLAPPAPGYILWSLPFLLHFMCRTGRSYSTPYFLYTGMYLLFYMFGPNGDVFQAFGLVNPELAATPTPIQRLAAFDPTQAALLGNLIFTTMQACLAGLALHMYVLGVQNTPGHRFRANPIMIGLAGDSGSGKDTITSLLRDLFGPNKVTVICGDDYHQWPRGHDMWQVYTHLNTRANKLHEQQRHALALSRGGAVVKGEYDHETGAFTEEQTLDPSETVILQGLHALSIHNQRMLFDLKIYLAPDEELRRFWKVRRDCGLRGYDVARVIEALEQREPDRRKFIEPQREFADLVIRFRTHSAPDPCLDGPEPALYLEFEALNSFDFHAVSRELRTVNTLRVEHEEYVDGVRQVLRVEGDITGEEIRRIASRIFCPAEELAVSGAFTSGYAGVTQLVILLCLNEKLLWRNFGVRQGQ